MKNYNRYLRKENKYVCSNGLVIKNMTIRNAIDVIGEKNYFKFINLFLTTPYTMKVSLWDAGIDYVDMTNYQLFVSLWNGEEEIYRKKKEAKEKGKMGECEYKDYMTYNELFEYFFESDIPEISYSFENEVLILIDPKSNKTLVDKLIYSEIVEYIRAIHFIDYKEEFNPSGKRTRRMIIEEEKRDMEMDKNKEAEYPFMNFLSSLIWVGSGGYTWETVYDLTVYQMYDGVKRIQKSKNTDYLFHGIYANGVDVKKISQGELQWNSKLK